MPRGYENRMFDTQLHDDNLPHNIFQIQKGKKKKRNRQQTQTQFGLNIRNIEPRTATQALVTDSFYEGQNILLHGWAGTGKTFISMYLALKDIIENRTNKEKLVVVRSVVPTRDMGFLPGSMAEKTKVYEAPYTAICTELFGRGDAYQILKGKGLVEFTSTSFIRGITLNNSIVLVDECQNMTFHELDYIITRMGDNCQIIFSGDYRQSDFRYENERDGIGEFMKIINNMNFFDSIEFNISDIVRSPLVRQYIIERAKHGM